MSFKNIINYVKECPTKFRTSNDAVVYFIHCCFLDVGFKLISLDEDCNIMINNSNFNFSNWNSNKDLYTFVYKHDNFKFHVVVKFLAIGHNIIITAIKKEISCDPLILDIKTDEVIADFSIAPALADTIYRSPIKFHNLVHSKIIAPFAQTEHPQTISTPITSHSPLPPRQTTLSSIAGLREEPDHHMGIGSSRSHGFPTSFDSDPMTGRPLIPNLNPYIRPGGDFEVDMNPSFSPFGMNRSPYGMGGGGNLMGPNHPMFTGVGRGGSQGYYI